MNLTARKQSQLALCLIFIMLFTSFASFTSTPGYAQSATPDITLQESVQQQAQAKINEDVQLSLAKSEYVDILIKLTEQVDTAKVAQDAKAKLSAKATPYQEKIQARFAVVDALRTTAQQTQEELLTFLKQEQANGTVKNVQSFYIVNMISATVSKDIVEKISYRADVDLILPDQKIELDLPDKLSTTQQEPTIQGIEWNIDRVGAPSVWSTYGIDGSGIVVGIIDTGAHWQHEALKEKWRGYDPANPNTPNPIGNWFDAVEGRSMPYDIPSIPHGSHVLGTILGQDPAGENIIGVAPGAQWIAARAFTEAGGQSSWLLAAGEYMLAPINQNGQADPSLAPDVINNSWGGGPGINEWYRPMVQAWRDANILPVFAAGNTSGGSSPGSVSTPANYPESFAVGATDSQDRRASFSNQGPGPYEGDVKPDLAAPGANIRSSVPNGYEAGWSGTSMAAPHIAGTAALLLSTNSALTVDEVEAIMMETTIPLTDTQYPDSPNYGYGHGLVNAFDAVSSIASGRGTISGQVVQEGSDTTPATITHEPLNQAYAGLDIPIVATIKDDIAVSRAELWVKQDDVNYWVVIPMDRISGDFKDGEYSGTIPWMFVNEPGFTYQIKAVDYGKNLAETGEFRVEVSFGVKPDEYTQDFTSYPLGWQLGGDWAWGAPTVGPAPVVGDKLVGTNLHGNYSHNSDSQMLLPPLDLRDATEASIRLHHWYMTEPNYDQGVIAVTNDYGENWEIVHSITGRDGAWRSMVLDLNAYAGSATPVYVLFALFSDGSVNEQGWYVDNVQVKGLDIDPPQAPNNLQAEAGSSGIRLTWEAPTDPDLHGYNVYRSTADTEYEHIGQTAATQFTDTAIVAGTTYTYIVKAYDYSLNESAASNTASATAPTVLTIFETDFEADDGGFTTGGTNNSFAWGIPTSGPAQAASGEKLWATNLVGNYSNSSNSWIEKTVDLSGVSSAEITFTHWYSIERNYDNAYLRISNDGGATWTELAKYTDRKAAWENASVALDQYVGGEVTIRFAFTSDGSVVHPGWYIDDVRIAGIQAENGTGDNQVGLMPQEENAVQQKDAEKEKQAKLEQNNEHVSLKDGQGPTIKAEEKLENVMLRQDETAYTYFIGEDKKQLEQQLQSTGGLPLDAVVTVLETGRSVRTNPMDGSFRLVHPATPAGETWTLHVESYGFYEQSRSFQLADEEMMVQNFVLDPIPKGDIQGQVVNERNGEPIEGASIQLMEDHRVLPVTSQADGSFALTNVLEGSYTLQISAANYHIQRIELTVTGGDTTDIMAQLKPFIGYDDEIAYDDGTAENARAFYAAGNGWAMRMTPNSQAQIRGASVYLWGTDWPTPGADKFSVAVFDSQPNGAPGNMVIAPVEADGTRGGWNYVDLSEYGFSTDRDFYVVMVQVGAYPNTPGLATDESGPFAGRSYMYLDGGFQELDSTYGNMMIRANVAYGLDAPAIQSPVDGTYTNAASIGVSGTVQTDSLVTIYVNGTAEATAQSAAGQFSVDIPLVEGDNMLQATATIAAGETDPSAPVTVIKDTQAPELTILAPTDGTITNKEVVTVQGTVVDDYLHEVTVNNELVQVNEAGEFSKRVIVDEGANVLEVRARDMAGNETVQEVTVHVNTVAPELTNIEPATDQHLVTGDTLQVSFLSSAQGGNASFAITIPTGVQMASPNRVQMQEVEPGYYVGTWTVPSGVEFSGAAIEIELYDRAGNRSTAVAEGKLYVRQGEGSDPGEPTDPTDPADPAEINRISFAQMVEASIQASQHGWDQANTVVLALANQQVEQASASVLAHQLGAPILVLEQGNELSADVQAELTRLGTTNVILLGSQQQMKRQVENQLIDLGLHVERIEGKNRTEITANLAQRIAPGGSAEAILVHENDTFTAFAVAAHAAQAQTPILLAQDNKLPKETEQALKSLDVQRILVVDPKQQIRDRALNKLNNVTRLTAQKPFELSIELAQYFTQANQSSTNVYIAEVNQFTPALPTAALMAKHQGTLLFVYQDTVPEEIAAYLSTRQPERFTLLGNEQILHTQVAEQLAQLLP